MPAFPTDARVHSSQKSVRIRATDSDGQVRTFDLTPGSIVAYTATTPTGLNVVVARFEILEIVIP